MGGAKGGEELRFVLDLMTNPGEEGSTRPLPKLTAGTELSDPKEVARLSLSLSTFHANTFGYLPKDRMGKGMGRDRIGCLKVCPGRRKGVEGNRGRFEGGEREEHTWAATPGSATLYPETMPIVLLQIPLVCVGVLLTLP